MALFSCSAGGEGNEERDVGRWFGPIHVDQLIRQAIQVCWMALPEDKRNVQEVERQIRRIVDRALEDLREDHEAFGRGDDV